MGYNTEVITNIADTDLQIARANGHYYIVRMYREDGYHEVLGDLDAGMMKQLAGFCYKQVRYECEVDRLRRKGKVVPPTPDGVEDLPTLEGADGKQ